MFNQQEYTAEVLYIFKTDVEVIITYLCLQEFPRILATRSLSLPPSVIYKSSE